MNEISPARDPSSRMEQGTWGDAAYGWALAATGIAQGKYFDGHPLEINFCLKILEESITVGVATEQKG